MGWSTQEEDNVEVSLYKVKEYLSKTTFNKQLKGNDILSFLVIVDNISQEVKDKVEVDCNYIVKLVTAHTKNQIFPTRNYVKDKLILEESLKVITNLL